GLRRSHVDCLRSALRRSQLPHAVAAGASRTGAATTLDEPDEARGGSMKRHELTQHTVRCPRTDETADLTVRTDPGAYPSRRHRDVTACSLMPSTSFLPSARRAYFPDLTPLSYVCQIHSAPSPPFN